jgi:crossover junction endodeoxyribonuclease RuvC
MGRRPGPKSRNLCRYFRVFRVCPMSPSARHVGTLLKMARMSVRDMWKAKLEGRSTPANGRTPVLSMQRVPFAGRVLGIDPSLRGTGLALIEFVPGRAPVLLKCATVRVPAKQTMTFALGEIHRAVLSFLDGTDVRHVALEQTIFVQNFQTAQILGAARGAAMAVAALYTRPVFEYAPLRVKQAVVGAGRASKEQMARTVMALLGHGRTLAIDEADAAGVALCHAFTWRE